MPIIIACPSCCTSAATLDIRHTYLYQGNLRSKTWKAEAHIGTTMATTKRTTILLIEDSPSDTRLIEESLRDAPHIYHKG